MKNLLRVCFAFFVFLSAQGLEAEMVFESKENIVLKGKLATVKTSKKYRSVEACQALCESRNSCVAFTLNTQKGSCTILKNVSSEVSNEDAVSGVRK